MLEPREQKKIFVYGSLRTGFFNYNKYLMGKVNDSKVGKVNGQLYHMPHKGYPALIEGNDEVFGEVMTLKDFACSKPELSLENKQAIIGAIALGGSLQTPGPRNKIQTYYHFNYHYTQRGLIRAFSDKLIQTDSEENQLLR